MRGTINKEVMRLKVALFDPYGKHYVIDCVVDTGFEGALTLPQDLIEEMQVPRIQEIKSTLADGSIRPVNVYEVDVLWHGKETMLAALAMGDRPLIGTALLMGNDIHIRFEEGGWFELLPLSMVS